MAGLFSGPKPPSRSNVVFVPSSPTPSTSQTTTSSPSGQSGSDQQTDDGGQAEQERAAQILSTNRGRLGTIRTGFTGILQERENRPRRKTLLGE